MWSVASHGDGCPTESFACRAVCGDVDGAPVDCGRREVGEERPRLIGWWDQQTRVWRGAEVKFKCSYKQKLHNASHVIVYSFCLTVVK